jgi:hypothetical protein
MLLLQVTFAQRENVHLYSLGGKADGANREGGGGEE